ncbi:MAG: alpha/beta hydrolase [Deltaproteobacteria bacterium]|nr:alpha/beta hydrolase [Deltaproteobacteria bacterium]
MAAASPAAVRRAELPGVTLAWEEHGSGPRPLLLVHGFTGSRDDFADVTAGLADLGRLVLVDQRGHGGSSNPGNGYDFAQLTTDLHGFFDAAGIERADLLGHSLGGMLALRFTLAHPERVASLILMDTSAGPVPLLSQALARMLDAVRRSGMRRLIAAVDAMALAGEDLDIARLEGEERFRDRARAKLEALDPAAFLQLAALLSDHAPVAGRLGEIRCPTTIVVGQQDVPFLAAAEELARGIAGSTLVRIPGAGHSPQKSGRAAWLEAVRTHVARSRGARQPPRSA